jgi:hypothetical protein
MIIPKLPMGVVCIGAFITKLLPGLELPNVVVVVPVVEGLIPNILFDCELLLKNPPH